MFMLLSHLRISERFPTKSKIRRKQLCTRIVDIDLEIKAIMHPCAKVLF